MTSRSSCTTKALHVVRSLSRRRPAGEAEEERGVPGRHLTALDLVGLGVGSTLGAGISVVTGEVARQLAGPSIAVSYLVAAAAAILSGLCYAELVARVPRAGSAYLYCYVALGEAWAFITAWNLLLAYSSGTSCLARAWSGTLDDLIHNLMGSTLGEHVAMDLPGLAPHPHFLSAVLILFLAGVLASGVKLSVVLNTVFTSVTIVVLVFIIIAGCVKGSISNWHISMENLTSLSNQTVNYGNGGFFPFGWEGTLAGAASCFYAFIGFDCIAAKVEEVQDPQRAVPLGILGSLLVCFLAYFGVSCALTLLVSYPLLDLYSPLPRAFSHMGWHTATYLVALSALCALLTSLLGVLYPMPQVLCAMARDGLLFKALGRVSSKQSPFVATLAMGSVAAFMALLLDLKVLIEVSSMGTLLAYTLVAVCILTLRYKEDSNFVHRPEPFAVMRLLRPPSEPTARTAKDVKILTVIIIFLVVALSVLLSRAMPSLGRHELWSLLLVSVLLAMLTLSVAVVWRQPENTAAAAFKVPCLPVLPILSVFINVYLLVQVRAEAWVVYALWMVLGIVLYLSYGLQHSLLGLRLKQERNQVDIESVSNRNVVDSAG